MLRQIGIIPVLGAVVLLLVGCGPARSTGDAATMAPRPSATVAPLPTTTPALQAADGVTLVLSFRDNQGAEIERTVDGNALRIQPWLNTAAVDPVEVVLTLEGQPARLGECTVAVGADACEISVRTDGWAWEARQLVGARNVQATASGGAQAIARKALAVAPKPVVLVHGLNSDHNSWINWISPGGYLEQVGLPGYAVDDGQFGVRKMNTGNPSSPLAGTNSIAENAQVLAEYVAAVRSNTGAERVDLVAHSLGGLISRYYVQNLMPVVRSPKLPEVPVANQLFMAGTPNGGTPCGRVAAALGLFSPASTQITPEYLTQVFNPATNDRRAVPFFAIAGDAVKTKLAFRCTDIPTDRYVSVRSVLNGIVVSPDQIEGTHSDLNNGRSSFERIFASLARSPADYPIVMDPTTTPASGSETVQNTLVQGGTLRVGETISVTLPIDQARSASFILLAPGSTVSMTIKTVAGKILTEATPKTNPNVTFERVLDTSIPLTLGYGVQGPKAGAWEIGLTAQETPPGGGPFAVVATLDTDLVMSGEAIPGRVRAGSPVILSATLSAPVRPQSATVRAEIWDGAQPASKAQVELHDDGQHGDGLAGDGAYAATWTPVAAGEHTVVITATGKDGTGVPFERLVVLGVQAD